MKRHHWDRTPEEWAARRRRGRRFFGLFLAGFAAVILLKMFGLIPPIFYSIRLGWPLILVVIGVIIGIKNGFRRNAWWILILIGGAFMFPDFELYGVSGQQLLWPVLLLVVGLVMIFRKRDYNFRGDCPRMRKGREIDSSASWTNDADSVNIDISFGSRKEIVTSKAFKGGVVRASFSGVELNLVSAEPGTQPMILEVYASFAGVEIIVPANWDIQNEIDPMMGNVEDERRIRMYENPTQPQTLILRGSCSFGSVEIKSY